MHLEIPFSFRICSEFSYILGSIDNIIALTRPIKIGQLANETDCDSGSLSKWYWEAWGLGFPTLVMNDGM